MFHLLIVAVLTLLIVSISALRKLWWQARGWEEKEEILRRGFPVWLSEEMLQRGEGSAWEILRHDWYSKDRVISKGLVDSINNIDGAAEKAWDRFRKPMIPLFTRIQKGEPVGVVLASEPYLKSLTTVPELQDCPLITAMASCDITDEETLLDLCLHEAWFVRETVATNPNCPEEGLVLVSLQTDWDDAGHVW